MSDVDVLLHPTSHDADESYSAGDVKTVIAHIALSIPAQIDPPDKIASMSVELRSDEVLGVSVEKSGGCWVETVC